MVLRNQKEVHLNIPAVSKFLKQPSLGLEVTSPLNIHPYAFVWYGSYINLSKSTQSLLTKSRLA